MSGRLIDTNLVSYQVKRDRRFAKYRRHMAGRTLYVSFQTVAELLSWAALGAWTQARRDDLDAVLSTYIVLHSDEDICIQWADVRAVRRHRPIPVADAWIAATALAYGLELVTHNPVDFAGVPGLTVITES